VVRPEWADYNVHMTDFRYGQVFGDAMDILYRQVGINEESRKTGTVFYTVESHVRHLGEAKVGERLYVTTQLLHVDDKRLHVYHRLWRTADDAPVATAEQMHLSVDRAAAKAAPMAAPVRDKLNAIWRSHAKFPAPVEAGQAVGSRAKR